MLVAKVPSQLAAAVSASAAVRVGQQDGLQSVDPHARRHGRYLPLQQHDVSESAFAAARANARAAPAVPVPNIHIPALAGRDTRNVVDPSLALRAKELPHARAMTGTVIEHVGSQQVKPWQAAPVTRRLPMEEDYKADAALDAAARTMSKEALLSLAGKNPREAHEMLSRKVFLAEYARENVDSIRFVGSMPLVSRPGSDQRAKVAQRIFQPRTWLIDPEEQRLRRAMVQAERPILNARLRN